MYFRQVDKLFTETYRIARENSNDLYQLFVFHSICHCGVKSVESRIETLTQTDQKWLFDSSGRFDSTTL